MGKRKYDSEKDQSPKKAKQNESEDVENVDEEQPQNEVVETENKQVFVSKKDSFDVKYFRKELAAKQGQTMGKFKLYIPENIPA